MCFMALTWKLVYISIFTTNHFRVSDAQREKKREREREREREEITSLTHSHRVVTHTDPLPHGSSITELSHSHQSSPSRQSELHPLFIEHQMQTHGEFPFPVDSFLNPTTPLLRSTHLRPHLTSPPIHIPSNSDMPKSTLKPINNPSSNPPLGSDLYINKYIYIYIYLFIYLFT